MRMRHGKWPFDEKPLIVFWEVTRACLLTCKHCRADAITKPLPGEIPPEKAYDFIDQLTEFNPPYPILILTGGDPLMREDIWDIISYAKSKGLRTSMAPSVTEKLDDEAIKRIADSGISMVSISIDSPYPEVHDNIRGIPGTWERSISVIRKFREYGVKIQVNTVVMRDTVYGLPDMVELLKKMEVSTWEVFYIIPVGRAQHSLDLKPSEWEEVSHFLYEASKYGILIRTVEGPMFRRVVLFRKYVEENGADIDMGLGSLYKKLYDRLVELLGDGVDESMAQTTGTRDGKGILFIAYNGDVYPSGFLPLSLGNVMEEPIKEIYRENNLLLKIRRGEFGGRCGRCEFRDICGGSRSRAYSFYGDPLAEDPACPYEPGEYRKYGFQFEGGST